MKGFNLHTELVEEMVNLPEPVNVKEYLIGKVYFKNRVPSVIFKIKETSRNLTKVSNPNKKEEENAMKNHYAQNILRTTNTLFENLEEVKFTNTTKTELIKQKIKEYVDNNDNEWRTVNEWKTITGDCNCSNATYHKYIATDLVNSNFLERKKEGRYLKFKLRV